MGHSYIIGKKTEFEVRDNYCEPILERLLDAVKETNNKKAQRLVAKWLDHWSTMPNGCKDTKIFCQSAKVRALLKAKLEIIGQDYPAGSQMRGVTEKLIFILDEIGSLSMR